MIIRKHSLTGLSSVLMGIICLLIAVSIPAGYSIISYNHMGGRIDSELAYSARDVEALAINNPDSWQFEEVRLQEILERRLRSEHTEKQLIRDLHGKIIAESGQPSAGPVRIFREPVYDGGEVIAYIVAESPLAPLFMRTALLGAGSVLLAVIIFLLFRSYPLRALRTVEEALKKNEEYFRAITESGSDMVIIVDARGVIRFATPSVEWIIGYRPEELRGKSAFDLIVTDEHHRAVKDFGEALLTRDVEIRNNFHVRHKDGRLLALEGTGKNLLHDPVIGGFLMNVRDATDRERAEEALRQSEAKFRSLVDNAFEAILILGLEDGKILFANNAAMRIFEGDESFFGRSVLDFIAPESMDAVVGDFMEVAGGRDGYLAEYYIISPRGKKICVESIGKVIGYEGQSASLVSIRDITERKRAEEEKAKLQEQLIQSRKMESVGRLAGGVAHDFNNMLGVIIGNVEIALRKIDSNHPVRTRLMDIKTAAERSADLTGQLLAFARKQTVAPRVIDMNRTIEGMLKMLRRLIGEDIKLTWAPHPGLWPVKIDPTQIDQLLANLCVNARDAIAGVGEVTIRTENAAFDEAWCAVHSGFVPGEHVRLAVSDTGSGMSKEVLKNLFEPFFTTKGLGQGTGLGLATVYGIVKQNDGFIDVRSEPGQGATFSIYLPRHEGPVEQDGAEELQEAMGGRETVLVVEDESSVLLMINRMLEEQGYRVLTAGAPSEAIRLMEKHEGKIDLLVTDTIMPGMNGRDMARKMLSLRPNLKCLYMSGYTADVISHKGVLDEGVHFIQKPFTVNQIAVKVREVLDQ